MSEQDYNMSSSYSNHKDQKFWSHQPRFVFCFGLYSSGSTWLFNVVIKLLENKCKLGNVARFYADQLNQFPTYLHDAEFVVVKSHMPDRDVVRLANLVSARVFITIRDPRDAVLSLVNRFSIRFDAALNTRVSPCASALVHAYQALPNRTFRFEDRFFEDAGSIRSIAEDLQAEDDATIDSVAQSLSRDSVKEEIARLAERGAFGEQYGADEFDPRTHWHYRHVGEARVGAYRDVFGPSEEIKIALATRDFSKLFDYNITSSLSSLEQIKIDRHDYSSGHWPGAAQAVDGGGSYILTAGQDPDHRDATEGLQRGILERVYAEKNDYAARYDKISAALTEAQMLAVSRFEDIQGLSDRLDLTQAALEETQALAVARFEEIQGLSDRLDVTQAALETTQALAVSLTAEIEDLNQRFGTR